MDLRLCEAFSSDTEQYLTKKKEHVYIKGKSLPAAGTLQVSSYGLQSLGRGILEPHLGELLQFLSCSWA